MMLSGSGASAASVKENNAPLAHEGAKTVSAKPKGCPKGFQPWGIVSKIETAKDGSVTELVAFEGGHIQKMPKFKPTKIYNRKVGDAYCVDSAPDND